MRMQGSITGALMLAALFQVTAAHANGGEAVFKANCASCHGSEGQGTSGLAPALKGDKFLSGKRDDVLATVRDGRSGADKRFKELQMPMPAWKGTLSDADLQAVVDYIRGDLQKHK